MDISAQLLDGVVGGHQGAEEVQPLRVEVRGEAGDAVLGAVDGGELGAAAQAVGQDLQAVAAHVEGVQLAQLGDALRQNLQVVHRQVQDLQGPQQADDVREGGELVPAQDEALQVGQPPDVLVDLCQTRTLAHLEVVEQGEGVDGRGESAMRGNPGVHTGTL